MKSLGIFFSTITLAIILLASCNKQTLATKPYHNLTGRYNAYYNANMRVMESFNVLEKQYQDNYNKPLHMYPYAAVESSNSVKQPLDEAITKCARNIKLHTVGNWTDDSYHLMGKAEFLQKEYERAANTFKYVVDKYHPENVEKELQKLRKKKKKKKKKKKRRRRSSKKKKKKKPSPKNNTDEEDEKPIKYGIKHRPVRYRSMLWLAKTYIELKKYDEAGYFLRQLENDKKVPHKLRPRVQAVIAYSWVKQKQYEKAVEPLEKAIKDTKRKIIKNRYVYLLGQIYQMQGNNQLAMENFHKVLRLRPSYEMEFNARLNMAKNAAGATGKKKIDPELALRRMLRDSKNEEYKDQIYFALAEIQLKSGDKEKGILALQQSLNHSASNVQRTEGCLLLAQLFYEKDDFVKAYAYYDSTMMVMAKTDDRYTTTEISKSRLEGLATNMAIVVDKDSMLTVGSWARAKQERWAIRGMESEELASQGAAAAKKPKAANIGDFKSARSNSMSAMDREGGNLPSKGRPVAKINGKITLSDAAIQKSKFPLYNANLKKKGEREFEKRWGGRAWVDYWRRSDRGEEDTVIEEDVATAAPKTQAEIDAYLKKKGVPANDQEMAATEGRLAEAMFKAAQHYREDLGRKDKALSLIKKLIEKYPKSTYGVEAMFLAYNIYSEDNNVAKANYYKNEILKKYPESNIAKVLSDPDFANSEKIKYEKINQYYDDTYALIQEGKAQNALDRVRAVPTEFGNNYEMKARFAILEAMCVGGLKGENAYVKALKVIVTSFPNTDEEKQAKAMIAILNGEKKTSKSNVANNNKGTAGDASPYKTNMKIRHMILVIMDDKKANVNQLRAPVTAFNNKFYLSSRLATSSVLVGKTSRPSLVIRSFNNGDLAMKYLVDARSNPEFLQGVEGFKIYAISQTNYGLLFSTQKFEEYIEFHDKNYR